MRPSLSDETGRSRRALRAPPADPNDLRAAGVSEREFHDSFDPHPPRSNLPDVILGGQDGLVNVLGVILGVAAATSDVRAVLAAGLAATFSESVSMAAVAYTSKRAEGDRYRGEEARERRHVRAVPNLEREEVRAIFRAKGFSGPVLDAIVETITADESTWVALMMAEEHRMEPVREGQPLRSATVVGVSSVVGSLLPLVPFLVLPMRSGMWAAAAVSSLALFLTGVKKNSLTGGSLLRGGVEMAAIGMASAIVGTVIGALLARLVA
jgi:VIT1/CCC1 family predicted Fe2+/Mn2+ transporter